MSGRKHEKRLCRSTCSFLELTRYSARKIQSCYRLAGVKGSTIESCMIDTVNFLKSAKEISTLTNTKTSLILHRRIRTGRSLQMSDRSDWFQKRTDERHNCFSNLSRKVRNPNWEHSDFHTKTHISYSYNAKDSFSKSRRSVKGYIG